MRLGDSFDVKRSVSLHYLAVRLSRLPIGPSSASIILPNTQFEGSEAITAQMHESRGSSNSLLMTRTLR